MIAESKVTAAMLGVLHHTLGLRVDKRLPYRNHFVAGPGHHDMPALEGLESIGLMARRPAPKFCDEGDIVFIATQAGQDFAIEHLPPEPKLTKYDEYLRNDGCESFPEFLMINKPRYETRGYGKSIEYRMFRRDLSVSWDVFPEVTGEWKLTKKEAKASYKEALKAYRERTKK